MSLVTEINRTNTQKENTKKVATQIDNKLIELGGERATDLNDVANKIPKMISDNYQKVAILRPNEKITVSQQILNKTINIDVPFEIGMFFVKVYVNARSSVYGDFMFSYDDKIGYLVDFDYLKVSVRAVTQNSITFKLDAQYSIDNSITIKEIYVIEKKVV